MPSSFLGGFREHEGGEDIFALARGSPGQLEELIDERLYLLSQGQGIGVTIEGHELLWLLC
jgi:hypothetical protein